MHFTADRKGNIKAEDSAQDRLAAALYGHAAGRVLLRLLVSPAFSALGGRFLDSGFSRALIPSFIKSHGIRMEDFEKRKYISYNDFFKRRLAPGARRVEERPEIFISPCDSRLAVYALDGRRRFVIKNTAYTAESLLRSRKLAEAYRGGYVWVFRLCVEDYHRYIYTDGGCVSKNVRIPGVFHTVNPAANDRVPIYRENTREYCLLRSENFGTLVLMEVGAMLVGRIENRPVGKYVKRGQEKGNFAFGGSTVILMTQAGTVLPDPDILENSGRGMETKVKLGEQVGRAGYSFAGPGGNKRSRDGEE